MLEFPAHPFGTTISDADILTRMQQCQGWEQRYRQVILWGKQLPVMPDELKGEQVLVSGCESQVWLVGECQQGVWQFSADSDARIVRGLIAIVLAAFNDKTSEQIQQFDVEDYFNQLGLLQHLSPSRGNGLRAIVEQVKALAEA